MNGNVQNNERGARRLLALRLDRGLSCSAAAKEIGISVPTLSRLEKGGVPQAATAKAVADYYGTTPSAVWLSDDTAKAAA